MKQVLKKVAYWTVPLGFQSIIQQVPVSQGLIFKRSLQEKFRQNSKFSKLHQGQRCFILATGPSINRQDLRVLKTEVTISVNHFYLHKQIKEIAPSYHVVAPNHYPFDFQLYKKHFEAFEETYSDQTNYFFGYYPYKYSVIDFLEQNPQFNKSNMYYLNYSASKPLDEDNYKNPSIWDICKSPFQARSAVYIAIQLAVYMGFKHIYLLGTDYDVILEPGRLDNRHFYDEEHNLNNLPRSTEQTFLAYYMTWQQYRLMREYVKLNDSYISNATEGGLLDVFPRVTLAEALVGEH